MDRNYLQIGNGFQLSYRIYGSGSRDVILLHGLIGGSWLGEEWISAIEAADVRLIVPDRPGYGGSSQITMNRVADWIPMIIAAADQLALSNVHVIGCSAGAPYAYATAVALPEHVEKVWVLGGVPAVYERSILEHYAPENQAAYKDFARKPLSSIQAYYQPQMKAALDASKDTREAYIIHALEEALTQECFGMAQESKLQIIPWGLDFSLIQQQITLHHSKTDEMVPYSAAQEMPKFFSNVQFIDIDTSELPLESSAHIMGISAAFQTIIRGL